MKIEDLSIAVFVKCRPCKGRGSVEEISMTVPRTKRYPKCPRCNGHGKIPIFVPLAELLAPRDLDGYAPKTVPDLVDALGRWLEKQEETE